MRTTLDIPENLIIEAMQLTSIKTKTALIIRALEELVRKNKISEIKKYKGRIALDADLDILRDRK
jgi:hypothetical protein